MAYVKLAPLPSGSGAVNSVNGQTGVVVLTKSSIGLGNVNNTSDSNKPISSAIQSEPNLRQGSITVTKASAEVMDGAPGLSVGGTGGSWVDLY